MDGSQSSITTQSFSTFAVRLLWIVGSIQLVFLIGITLTLLFIGLDATLVTIIGSIRVLGGRPQELLRHANSRITLDIYTRAISATKREANNKVMEMVIEAGKTRL